ncbi:MAG: two-component sensor histidine kinase [Meiothermus sp.]
MKWWNRLEVRLIALMVLVALLTNAITYTVTNYSTAQRFRELPSDVREFLLREDARPLPFDFSVQLGRRLETGEKVSVQLLPPDLGNNLRVMLLSRPDGSVDRIVGAPPPPHTGSFRSRLQQGLLVGTVLSAVLGVLVALVFARRLARPLEAISKTADRLAQGDLSARIAGLRGNDETANLARNFNRMAESLEGLEAERRAMIADIAHELRTPLTVMQGRLEAIQDGVTPLEMTEVDRLYNQAKLLSRLVEDLRTLSLADAGKLTLLRRPLDLREVVESVVGSFQAQAKGKKVRLETLLSAQPLTLAGDPDRLTQVIGNLLANALAHTPAGGAIRLEVRPEDHRAVLRIADTGPGIPEGAVSKVFDRFYRAESSRSRQTGGSGLGLSIVKTLVELHGGTVKAANRPSGGAEFEVSLPLGTEALPRQTPVVTG